MLAQVFGGGVLLDAFYVAYRIPHLFRDMLAEGALGSSFAKNYAQAYEDSPRQALQLALRALMVIFALMSVIVALGILLREPLVTLMSMYDAPDDPTFHHTSTALTGILFPLIALSSLAAVFSGILAHQRRFLLMAVAPACCNVGAVVGLVVLGPQLPAQLGGLSGLVLGLAVGTLAGALIQLVVLAAPNVAPLCGQLRYLLRRQLSRTSHAKVLRESLPMILVGGVAQIQVIIATNFATSLAEGTVSWLHLAFRLFQLPVGLFAVAKATVILPLLSAQLSSRGTLDSRRLTGEVSSLFWIIAFCMCVTLMTGDYIVELVYFGGNFREHDAMMTTQALKAYSWGMMGYALMKILLSYYYAAERTHVVLSLALTVLILTTISHLLFLDIYGFVGMAAVTSGSLTLQGAVLMGIIYIRRPVAERRHLLQSCGWAVVAGVLAMLMASGLKMVLSPLVGELIHASLSTPIIKVRAAAAICSQSALMLGVFVLAYRLTQRELRWALPSGAGQHESSPEQG